MQSKLLISRGSYLKPLRFWSSSATESRGTACSTITWVVDINKTFAYLVIILGVSIAGLTMAAAETTLFQKPFKICINTYYLEEDVLPMHITAAMLLASEHFTARNYSLVPGYSSR
jgi:hypothetical protein